MSGTPQFPVPRRSAGGRRRNLGRPPPGRQQPSRCGRGLPLTVPRRPAGEPIYEVIRPIAAHSEIVVFYLPEPPQEEFVLPAVAYLRHSLYKKTMYAILEGKSTMGLGDLYVSRE